MTTSHPSFGRPAPRRRRGPAVPPPGRGTGRLLQVDAAGGRVLTGSGTLRATWGGAVLAGMAAAGGPPRPGALVEWCRWPDRRVTIESVRSCAGPDGGADCSVRLA